MVVLSVNVDTRYEPLGVDDALDVLACAHSTRPTVDEHPYACRPIARPTAAPVRGFVGRCRCQTQHRAEWYAPRLSP